MLWGVCAWDGACGSVCHVHGARVWPGDRPTCLHALYVLDTSSALWTSTLVTLCEYIENVRASREGLCQHAYLGTHSGKARRLPVEGMVHDA